ncbi:hypothetical protein MRX96_014207 [Rhipicephalus microplus]
MPWKRSDLEVAAAPGTEKVALLGVVWSPSSVFLQASDGVFGLSAIFTVDVTVPGSDSVMAGVSTKNKSRGFGVILAKGCGNSWMTQPSIKYVVTLGFDTIMSGKRRKGAEIMKPLPASGEASFGRAAGCC